MPKPLGAAAATESSRLQEDEDVVLKAYASCVSPYSDPNYRRGCPLERTFVGPRIPNGWFVNLNDEVLLTYDPYFRSTRKRDDVAPRLLSTSDDRYYADQELPVCKPSSFSFQSSPPLGEIVTSTSRGRHLRATRKIRAGEIVAMDSSAMVMVHDPRAYLYPPPPPSAPSASRFAKGKTGAETTTNHHHKVFADDKVEVVCRRIFQRAAALKGMTAAAVDTKRLQMICSLLITHGDVEFLPRQWRPHPQQHQRTRDTSFSCCGCGNTQATQLFDKGLLRRSARAEREVQQILGNWWRVDSSLHPSASAQSHANHGSVLDSEAGVTEDVAEGGTIGDTDALYAPARCALSTPSAALVNSAAHMLQCFPAELLRESTLPRPTSCCGTKVRVFGFLARIGLGTPQRLATWFSVWDANAIGLHVPDLLERSALFPFARLMEHECRPNCAITVLDCPATHVSGVAGVFHYDTKPRDAKDIYESGGEGAPGRRLTEEELAALWWPCPSTSRIFSPSLILVTATRDIESGESLTISYIPGVYMPQAQRQKELWERHQFRCLCRWCNTEPDLARAFRCPKCEENRGVICPVGDGRQLDLWMCLQCGYHPDVVEEIPKMLDHERALQRVKADKARGLVELLSDPFVHYSHALVFRKLDLWGEQAWQEQDANQCIAIIEALQRCAARVFEPCDAAIAQYHEFMGQVQHAVGNAHTARFEYFQAYQIRVRAGTRLAHWTRKTQFMGTEKGLIDFLDSR